MPTMADALVVDTSVLVKWIRSDDEELLAEAHALLRRVEGAGTSVYAPTLQAYELGNILTRESELAPDRIADILDELVQSRLILAPPEPELLTRGVRLARQYDITFYDAAFVALAELLHCQLVTADRQLARRTRELGFVRHLSDAKDIP